MARRKPRNTAWPYRDYVIRAFNTDKPYGRFVEEQIAGDVLYPNTLDGNVALGFIAAGPWDYIGHVEVPESKFDGQVARHLDRDDMVQNATMSFLSLTVGCAQCHDHKFDPILQTDYYALQAVFAALDRADRSFDTDPQVAAERERLTKAIASLETRQSELQRKLHEAAGRRLAEIDRQLDELAKNSKETFPAEHGYHSRIESTADSMKWVQVDLGQPVRIDRIELVACHDNYNHIGAGFGFPLRYRVEVCDDPEFQDGVVVIADRSQADVPNPGIAPQLIAGDQSVGRFVRVTATRLAPRSNDYIFAISELKVFDREGDNVAAGQPVTALDSIEAAIRWGRANLVDGLYPQSVGADDRTRLQAERAELLKPKHVADIVAKAASLDTELKQLSDQRDRLPSQQVVYAGTVHTGKGNFRGTGPDNGVPRTIHLAKRGNLRDLGPIIAPATVDCVVGLSGDLHLPAIHTEGDRRAAFARWMTDRANSLTWRSIVNRIWLHHFGRGIVETPNDFGRMGQLPTHPALLDWLAVELRDGEQSIKHLHRLIVNSAVYRQSSVGDRAHVQVDADNHFYWRQNRRRLDAESVRDAVLQVSGKLDLTMGGPSFQDFVSDKPAHSPHYEYRLHDPNDPKSHRRSIYRFIVRSQTQPFMTVMDCADPSIMVAKRNQTITPLQALAMLNNQLMLAMSQHFANHVQASGSTTEEHVARAFQLALQRDPIPEELTALSGYAEQHGLVNACRAILNLNEFLFVD